MDFENFDEEQFLKHELGIFCIATHYEGDPCDNTKKFFKYIREKLKSPNDLLKNLKFSLFGLGDTSYEQYNEMGRYFNKGF